MASTTFTSRRSREALRPRARSLPLTALQLAAVASIGIGALAAGACAHRPCGDAPGAAPRPNPGSSSPEGGGPLDVVAAPAWPAGATFCRDLARDNEAALAPVPASAPFATAWRRAATCMVTARAAWGLSIAGTQARDGEIWARWSLRHLRLLSDGSPREDPPVAPPPLPPTGAADGARDGSAPEPNLEWSEARRVVPLAPTFFDFDGDGDVEAIVVMQTEELSESGLSHTARRGRVWSASGKGVIVPYPPARDIIVEDVRDIDGDGRPDLLTRSPYAGSAVVRCGSEEPYPVVGPLLVAHALGGGTFATGDAVAAAAARRECPAPPPKILRPDAAVAGAIDLVASARNVACARLWGAPAAPLIAAIASACHPTPGAVCAPCDEPDLLERWARVPPPLLLGEPKR